jgi:6,7-dimethyl-8-ribityllumazine synthase
MAKKTSAATKRDRLRILIVEARFYDHIADALLRGAKTALDAAAASYKVITVPGALEVPGAIAMVADSAKNKRAPYDGYVALGCVIQGETYHFDLVANESAHGLMQLTLTKQLAVGNGILTVDNEAQALARSGDNEHNKGAAAARAALTMVALKRELAGK